MDRKIKDNVERIKVRDKNKINSKFKLRKCLRVSFGRREVRFME